MKLIPCLAILPATVMMALPANGQPGALKLWPQITPGIYNHANVLVMRCQVADDGLTVTDAAWDSYAVEGCGKRWTLNMGSPMKGPLKDYKFGPEFSGLPVNLTVEFYNPAKPWEVKENYQEILLLGGKPGIGLPEWFHTPTNRLGYDFDEGNWFPSGWKLPRGKYALWQGAAKARQQDRQGECPLYDYGFTHVAPCAMTRNGSPGTRDRRALLFGDNEWIPHHGNDFTADPTDPKNWKIETFHHHAEGCAIIIPDFEAPGYHSWKDYQYDAFAKLIGEVRDRHPDVLIGCWGVGVLRSSFRIFDSSWEGKPTGVIDINGAKQWREKYDNPAADLHSVFQRCHLNLGNPSVYWINNSKPSQLYAFVQEWEQGKLARPGLPNILSTWIQVEFVDNYPLSQYRFTDAKGKTRREGLKHQAPASSTYALSLFGHCVMDGLQCWEVGTRYSEELGDYSDWRVPEPIVKRAINGVEVDLNYYLKYFGFYNFHVLGMWQASQNKDIIEAATAWEMPELKTSKGNVWRTGDERYPSYVSFHKEPLVRTKLSADGKTLLVVACNPHNQGVEQVRVRRPGGVEEHGFELAGDYPVVKRFAVAQPARWNIASYLYLLNHGRYDQAASEANIDYAARLGFNAIRFNVWWHEIFPDAAAVKAGGHWAGLDHNLDYAIRKGLKVILTLSLRAPPTTLFAPEDCVMDADGAVDKNWDKTTRMSFASPRFGRAIRFVQQVGERYRGQQNAGHLLAIAPLVTREAEIPYSHDRLEDYHPAFIREFRAWLENRYGHEIAQLNQAWNQQLKSFGEVAPPRSFGGTAGRDWYRFRDLKARQFVDSCAAALSDIPGVIVPYRLLLDYGNVGDPMAWKRGSLSFGFHAEQPMVWGVKHNDAHDYDQAYTGSLLGSTMRRMNKLAFNEWFYEKDKARYPGQDVIGDSFREIKAHYDQGMDGVSYVGVHPPNPDLEAIVARLKKEGVWTAPVTERSLGNAAAVHVTLSSLLELSGWEIKQRHFDPQLRAGQRQVHVVIDNDFTDPLLPIIRPLDYSAAP